MPINSRAKGARAERELSRYLGEKLGWTARRTAQRMGKSGDASDVVVEEAPALHIECKMVERLNLEKAMEQAMRDCLQKLPVVCHRKIRGEWMLTVHIKNLKQLSSMVIAAEKILTGLQEGAECPRGST